MQQHVIWNVVEEREFDQTYLFEEKVEVRVTELKVRISDSLPDGRSNQVFPKSLF